MQVTDWCKQHSIGLVAVGPEQPLVDGLTDALEQADIRYRDSKDRQHCLHVWDKNHCSWLLVCLCMTEFTVFLCRVFGPSARAARLEGSKQFMKVT